MCLLPAARPVLAQSDFQQRKPDEPPPPPKTPTVTKGPKAKAPPAPVYPAEALAAGLTADVTLLIDIDAAGAVTGVTVTRPAGQGFDEAAVAAAREMQFEPAEIDGVPGAIRVELVLHFRPPAVPDGGADGGAPADALPADAGLPAVPAAALPAPKSLVAHGRVREKGTRDPVVGADVSIQPLGAPGEPEAISEVVAATDEEGAFSVLATPGRRVRLVVADGDHEPCVRDLDLLAGAAPVEVLCTVARRQHVYESVVEAPKQGEEVTRHTISQPELTSVPGTFGDPLRVIQNLPGVARSPFGLGLLLVRGAAPQDSGVYIDGHRVPLLYHFAVGPSVLTPDLIDKIDFYPGGFGVRYGRATAGVVDVTTRTEPLKRAHGSADIDFLDSGAYLEAPLGNGWSGSAAARRSYIDTVLAGVLPENEVVAAPVYWDYQARATRDFAPGERLSFFAFGSSDSLEVVTNGRERGDIELGTKIGFHRLITTWKRPLGAWTSRLSPSYGYDSFDFKAGQVQADASAHVLGLREDLTRPLGRSLTLAMGLDGELRFDRLTFNVPLPPGRRTYGRTERTITSLGRDLTNLGTAAYVEALWDVVPSLRVVPGVRFDWFHYNATDKLSVDPRIVVRWTRSPTQAWKAGAGVFRQPPDPGELDSQFGNPNLPLLWSDQYHLGFEQGFTDALSLDATAYYLRRHNLPIASSRRFENYAAEGVGRSYGLEVLLKHRPTRHFFGWISYTLSRSEEITVLRTDPNAPALPYRPTQFDQTHNLILVGSWTVGAWELGTRFRLVTGVPDTPVLGGLYDSDYDNWRQVDGEPGSLRHATFHQLDLRAERTWTFDSWRLSAYLDLQNVYNAQNPEATLYDYRYRQSGPVRGLPILPVLGVRGRF